MVQADAVSFRGVLCFETQYAGCGEGRRGPRRDRVGIHAPVERFAGQAESMARVKLKNRFPEPLSRLNVLRVRRGAIDVERGIATAIDGFAAIALGVGE